MKELQKHGIYPLLIYNFLRLVIQAIPVLRSVTDAIRHGPVIVQQVLSNECIKPIVIPDLVLRNFSLKQHKKSHRSVFVVV